jgi:5-methylcytosine-specific restriction endonuclease McrA
MNSKYREYLFSPEWKKIRESVLKRDDNRCRLCNSTSRLEVHHRVYPDVYGQEKLIDLITICKYCHKLFHDKREIQQKIFKRKKRAFFKNKKNFEKEIYSIFKHNTT